VSSDLGPLSQNPVMALVTPLFGGRKVLFPIPVQRDPAATMRHLGDLLGSGAFRPLIDRRYPLGQIVEAYRYVETGQKLGNVVITFG
jgi:NADPH:quinone reductase-like Zn-dependent oxidoreductase